jgi:hypothetical protein
LPGPHQQDQDERNRGKTTIHATPRSLIVSGVLVVPSTGDIHWFM